MSKWLHLTQVSGKSGEDHAKIDNLSLPPLGSATKGNHRSKERERLKSCGVTPLALTGFAASENLIDVQTSL